MHNKRMIIFGCGYAGSPLARNASQQGYEVWVQSRNRETLAKLDHIPPERRIACDLQSSSWHDTLAGDWDVAVNLVSSAGGGLDGYYQSYIKGNQSILEWSGKVSLERFIYTSATSVYPQSDGSWVSEEDVPDLNQLSASGKILREAEILIMENTSIPSKVILRLAGIYGPLRHLYLDKLRDGVTRLPGEGSSWLNLIYLKDIVGAILLVAGSSELSPREIFNVVDDRPSLKQDIVDWLAEELGVPGLSFDPTMENPRASRRLSSEKLPDRRVSNACLKGRTGWQPQFADYRQGYRDILR